MQILQWLQVQSYNEIQTLHIILLSANDFEDNVFSVPQFLA
jgi:hypothetical protein